MKRCVAVLLAVFNARDQKLDRMGSHVNYMSSVEDNEDDLTFGVALQWDIL